jgi:hypothetical protein
MWINTKGEYQWNGSEYVEVSNERYWHDGTVAELKKDSAAPDYTPMAEATREATKVMSDYADKMMIETRRQYEEFAPIAKDAAKTQLDIMKQSKEQGDDYYNYNKETFRPAEQGLVADVNNYNTDAEKEKLALKAAADVATATKGSRESDVRLMSRMGVNPNSGKALAMVNQSGLATAGMKAGAMTGARDRAEQIGYAKKLDVIGMGRGLPGASQAAYGTASNTGSAGVNSALSPSNLILNGMNNAAGVAGQGQNMNIQGQQSILNSQNSVYNANANKTGFMDVVGAGLGAAGTYMALSGT